MTIAVILTKDKKQGGVFRYALAVSLLLAKNNGGRHNFVFFTTVKENIGELKKHGLNFHYLRWSDIDRFLNLIFSSALLSGILARLGVNLESRIDRILSKHGTDLVYFLNPSDLALGMDRLNYIFTIWDLGFLEQMEFPELYIRREFERRDRLYQSALRKAVKVITDSEEAKKSVIQRYDIASDRVASLPFFPADLKKEGAYKDKLDKQACADIRRKYKIGGEYIFYPAQFWPHKNHIYILEGLKLLKDKYHKRISAVFTGSDKGNLRFVLRRAEELGVGGQLYYLGFVGDEEIPCLYAQALALVMPTYLGPTNMPPWEAISMGCPVLYSDLPGLQEQLKCASLPLDLKDPESMCRGLLKIIEGGAEIRALLENGKKKIESLLKADHWGQLKGIFDDYAVKTKCWK